MLRQPWFNFGLMIDGDIGNVVRMSEAFYRYLYPLNDWGKRPLTLRARKRLWQDLGRVDPLPKRVDVVVSREALEEAVTKVLGNPPLRRPRDASSGL